MTALITYSQVTQKHITSNITAAKFAMYLDEAQEFDLRPLLGTELYIDLLNDAVNSPPFGVYEDLMNGNTYTKNSRQYKHEGLIPVIAYYTYSRYLMDSGVNSTPYGIVQKTNDYSQPTSEKTIARKVSQAQSGAKAYWERVQQYILDNKTENFLNLYRCANSNLSGQGVKITAIGGNSNDRIKYRS